MDEVLRCPGCGLPVELADDIVNLAGRRWHRMCTSSHHLDTTAGPSRRLRRLRGWVNLGLAPGR